MPRMLEWGVRGGIARTGAAEAAWAFPTPFPTVRSCVTERRQAGLAGHGARDKGTRVVWVARSACSDSEAAGSVAPVSGQRRKSSCRRPDLGGHHTS